MLPLALLILALPILELWLLVRIAGVIGGFETLALVILTGVAGVALARLQAGRALRRWSEALASGRVPEEGVLEGVLMLGAGVMLLIPGVLSDAVGLLLLIPVVRRLVARRVRGWLEGRVRESVASGATRVRVVHFGDLRWSARPESHWSPGRKGVPGPDGIIDAEFEVHDEPRDPPRLNR